MSMYTNINIELEADKSIKRDLDVLVEMSNPHCTTDAQFEIEGEKLKLHRTYNYGYKKALYLLKKLETYISTDEIKELGSFSSEDIGVDFGSVYTISSKLYIVKIEHISGYMHEDVCYIVWDTDGKRKEFMKSDFSEGNNALLQGIVMYFQSS